jgi:hypothetical protein
MRPGSKMEVGSSARALLRGAGISDAQLDREVRETGNEAQAHVRLLTGVVEGPATAAQKGVALDALIRLAPADDERAYWQRLREKMNLGRLERTGVVRIQITGGRAGCAPCRHFVDRVYPMSDSTAAEMLPPESCPEIAHGRSCELTFCAATRFASLAEQGR